MPFNVGDKVKNLSDREGVILDIAGEIASVDYGRGDMPTSLKYLTLVKAAKIPTWKKQLTTIAANLPSVDAELLNETVAAVSKVRVICPERLEEEARQLFDREGIIYPEGWRGTELGKRGGTTEQRSLSATINIPQGALSAGLVLALEATGAKVREGIVTINSFDYALRLLVDGKASGWKITESV